MGNNKFGIGRWVTTKEFQERYGYKSINSVYHLLRTGKVRFIRVGKRKIFIDGEMPFKVEDMIQVGGVSKEEILRMIKDETIYKSFIMGLSEDVSRVLREVIRNELRTKGYINLRGIDREELGRLLYKWGRYLRMLYKKKYMFRGIDWGKVWDEVKNRKKVSKGEAIFVVDVIINMPIPMMLMLKDIIYEINKVFVYTKQMQKLRKDKEGVIHKTWKDVWTMKDFILYCIFLYYCIVFKVDENMYNDKFIEGLRNKYGEKTVRTIIDFANDHLGLFGKKAERFFDILLKKKEKG